MNRIWFILFIYLLSGCFNNNSDKVVEVSSRLYLKSTVTSSIKENLLNICEPDQWCAPYLDVPAAECFDKLFDIDHITSLSGKEYRTAVEEAVDEITYCTMQEMHSMHSENMLKKQQE